MSNPLVLQIRRLQMRSLLTAFLILSPFIAIAQNYHLHASVHSLNHEPVAHIARAVVANASMKMSAVVHAVQELLS